MYTNTSKFRVHGKYGLFTIPKGILNEAGWKPGDLIGFWGLDGKVIHIEKINKEQLKKLGADYNKKVYKKLARFGGHTGTCGIKSLPEFLMKEFKPKNGQTIYFLPAKYTWFVDQYLVESLNNIIFAAFNPNNLRGYEKGIQENVKEEKDKIFQDLYKPPFFRRKTELTERNTPRSRNRIKTINITANRDEIRGREEMVKKMKEWLRAMGMGGHSRKNEIIKELKKSIKDFQLKIKDLEKNPVERFKEWKE